MGQLILDDVVQALCDAGFAAESGYPQGGMQSISKPVCAVNLKSADLTAKQTAVLVQVVSPAEKGAAVCEQAALKVGEVLHAQGGQCDISSCGYDSRTGLFSVDVTVVFAVEKPRVIIEGTQLQYVQSFSAWRTLDSKDPVWATAPWHFELEEWIPVGLTEQTLPEESFTLIHTGGNGTETFTEATWTYQKREWEPSGVRQIRMGVAGSMKISIAE